jgi:hypothetical protein
MSAGAHDPLLTLEPLVDAVRDGVEAAGWLLSGLQKTTSHQFEGRWAGDSTRSAYLFFHHPTGPEWASVDVYLDETSKGLSGNLALVVDARDLGELGDVVGVVDALGRLSDDALPAGYPAPITLRFRKARVDGPEQAETEIRFKLRVPRSAILSGASGVSALAAGTVTAFETILADARLERFLDAG